MFTVIKYVKENNHTKTDMFNTELVHQQKPSEFNIRQNFAHVLYAISSASKLFYCSIKRVKLSISREVRN